MGTLVVFPEVRRPPQQNPPLTRAGHGDRGYPSGDPDERQVISSPASATKKSRSPSVRKRRKRATQT